VQRCLTFVSDFERFVLEIEGDAHRKSGVDERGGSRRDGFGRVEAVSAIRAFKRLEMRESLQNGLDFENSVPRKRDEEMIFTR